jgi:hypothetical protein
LKIKVRRPRGGLLNLKIKVRRPRGGLLNLKIKVRRPRVIFKISGLGWCMCN